MIKDLFRIPIKNAQDKINKEYEKHGLTNEILEAQVELNTIRHALNIPDEDEKIYKEFVQ